MIEKPRITTYLNPAGGWDALHAVAKSLARQRAVAIGGRTLLRANQESAKKPFKKVHETLFLRGLRY